MNHIIEIIFEMFVNHKIHCLMNAYCSLFGSYNIHQILTNVYNWFYFRNSSSNLFNCNCHLAWFPDWLSKCSDADDGFSGQMIHQDRIGSYILRDLQATAHIAFSSNPLYCARLLRLLSDWVKLDCRTRHCKMSKTKSVAWQTTIINTIQSIPMRNKS